MKTLTALSGFVLPFMWVAAPPVVHATQCNLATMSQIDYMHCIGQQNDPNYYDTQREGVTGIVCANSNDTSQACNDCKGALGNGNGSFQAGWACGVGGRDNWYTNKFPCTVMNHPTGRDPSKCAGDLQADGIHQQNGTIEPLAGMGPK